MARVRSEWADGEASPWVWNRGRTKTQAGRGSPAEPLRADEPPSAQRLGRSLALPRDTKKVPDLHHRCIPSSRPDFLSRYRPPFLVAPRCLPRLDIHRPAGVSARPPMPRAAANAPAALPDAAAFITRWQDSGAAERANYQLFLTELCDLLGVPGPDPTKRDDAENAYVFERSVTFHHPDGTTSTGRIALYQRGCFVLESGHGVEKREAAEVLAEATRAKAKVAKKGHAQRGSPARDEAMLKERGPATPLSPPKRLPPISNNPARGCASGARLQPFTPP